MSTFAIRPIERKRLFEAAELPPTRYRLYERVGTGFMQPCAAYSAVASEIEVAENWLVERAASYTQRGYRVELNVAQGWYLVTRDGSRIAQAVICEVTE